MAASSKAVTPTPAAADPANPTAAELAAAGVEIDVNPEPPRAKFREGKLKGEPGTDRKITLKSGVTLRERIVRVPLGDHAVSAGPVADGAFNLVITHALLTADGAVAKAPEGGFRIKAGSHQHEVAFDAERMGAMSEAEITAALLQQREAAAHRAELFFAGIEKGGRLFGDRVIAPTPAEEKE